MASFFDNKARAAAAKSAGTSNGASSSKTQGPKDPRDSQLQPWVEKYRPKTLADISSQTHTTTLLERTLRAPNLPHMLFYGPPGTGKTSTILALSKQLFGPDLFRSRVLELNASDERGIGIVRSKIKDFARQQLSAAPAGPAGEECRNRYPCPAFKIIVLDEADSMTQDAQSALRRTMENYSKITRFCLICNYVTRIIDPLASRCSKFRFKSLDSEDAVARLENIARAEGVKLDQGVPQTLASCAEGDLRRAITFLQSAARLVGATGQEGSGHMGRGRKKKSGAASSTVVKDEEDDGDAMDLDEDSQSSAAKPASRSVTVSMVEEIAGVIPDRTVSSLVEAIKPNPASSKPSNGQKGKGTVPVTNQKFKAITDNITLLIQDGWPASQLLTQLYEELIKDETIVDKAKVRILAVFGESDKRLVDGADEELTCLDLAMRCAQCFRYDEI